MALQPYVSVVIPTYNRREHLSECLRALEDQTYSRDCFEVVVVNDGSSDGTEEFLSNLEKQGPLNLKPVSQENGGISAARNAGIAKAAGDIVCFIDDDCLAEPGWIASIVAGYSDGIGCVGGNIVSKPSSVIERYADRNGIVAQRNGTYWGPVVTSNTSYLKSALSEAGGFDPDIPTCEDGELGLRVRLKGYSFAYVPEAVVCHKHRSTLNSMIKQQFRYGVGSARLNKKYPMHFSPRRRIVTLPAKIALRFLSLPIPLLKAPFSEEKDYCLAEPFLDMIVYGSLFCGLFYESVFGRPYVGVRHLERLGFVP